MKIKTGGWLHARDGRNILEYRPSGIVKRTLDFKKKKGQKTHHVELRCLSVAHCVPLDKFHKFNSLGRRLVYMTSWTLTFQVLVSWCLQLYPQPRHAEPSSWKLNQKMH